MQLEPDSPVVKISKGILTPRSMSLQAGVVLVHYLILPCVSTICFTLTGAFSSLYLHILDYVCLLSSHSFVPGALLPNPRCVGNGCLFLNEEKAFSISTDTHFMVGHILTEEPC